MSEQNHTDSVESFKKTEHAIELNGKKINYYASAGYMSLYTDKMTKSGEIFFVTYMKKTKEDGKKRPVSFVIDGGPGASSLMLHMNFFGPKIVEGTEKGIELPKPPYSVIDNKFTLLDRTDLIFIDPVGTGYSRASEEVNPHETFWGVKQDIESICEFIQLYMARHGLYGSPIYLIGQSYGGFRCGALASGLQDKGIQPSGIVLISPALSYGELAALTPNDRPHVHNLPTMCNAAWYHKKLSREFLAMDRESLYQKAKFWAENDYLEALWKGNTLTEKEKRGVAEKYSSFTALRTEEILQHDLRVSMDYFASNLLREKGVFLGGYDARLAAPGGEYNLDEDPSLVYAQIPAFSALQEHLSLNLGFREEREYLFYNKSLYPEWDFTTGLNNPLNRGGGFACTITNLSRGLRRNPKLKVFVAMGNYDLRCSRASFEYSINHLEIPKTIRDEIIVKDYDGGHMLYMNPAVRKHLKNDLERFYDAE